MAAEANNGICSAGVAYDAKIGGNNVRHGHISLLQLHKTREKCQLLLVIFMISFLSFDFCNCKGSDTLESFLSKVTFERKLARVS